MNTVLLEKAISDSGLKKKCIASQMGFTVTTLKNKTTGKTNITGEEIIKLCNILNISDPKQKSDIFLS